MKRQQIQSSTIRTAGYENGVLELEFSSTAIYRYTQVPEEVWKAFLATDSKGSYFVCRIRDRFAFECVYRPSRKEKTNGSVEKKQEEAHGEPNRKEALPTARSSQARTQKKKARIS